MRRPHRTDSDPGWINRRFARIERELREFSAAKRLAASSVESGGVTVKGGGSVVVEDGGFYATWPGGVIAAMFGPLTAVLGGLRKGLALTNETGGVYFSGNYDPDSDLADVQAGLSAPVNTVFFKGDTQAVVAGPNSSRALLDDNGLSLRGSLDTGTGDQVGSKGVYITPHGTTSSAANVHIATDGLLSRSTSSERYKQDIGEHEIDVDAVLALQPRQFRDRGEVSERSDDAPTRTGFIAEEAAALGLEQWVTRDAEGCPDEFAYAQFCVAQQAVIQRQQRQLDDQATAIADLTARIDALEG